MGSDGKIPKYHPGTLEEVAHLLLVDMGRRLDDLVDGDVSGLAKSLATFMRVVEGLAPDAHAALIAAVTPPTPARAVLDAMAPTGDDEWSRYGIVDPVDVMAWQVLRVGAREAHRYLAAGLTPFDVHAWDGDTPDNIVVYRRVGWEPGDMVPTLARDVGASAAEALQALGLLRGGDVTTVTLRAALLWTAAFPGDVTADTYPRVLALAEHVSPEEALRWNVPPATVLGWVEAGHTRHTFEDAVAAGADPSTPTLYVPRRGRAREAARLGADVDEFARHAGWVPAPADRADPLPHVSWRAYTKPPFTVRVRSTHGTPDFAELYIDGQLCGFAPNQPDLLVRLSDILAHPHPVQFNTLGLCGALITLQNAGWVVEAHPKGPLSDWYATTPPAYYGLTEAQVHTMLGTYQFGSAALDTHWVHIVARRGAEQIGVAATIHGEILTVVTPAREDGVWGKLVDRAVEQLCTPT